MPNVYAKIDELPSICGSFRAAIPYKFANVGALFEGDTLRELEQEVANHIGSIPIEKNIYASFNKHKLSDISEMPPQTAKFVAYLNSPEFLTILQRITGISDLHGDPDLQGGGIHAIGNGGFLKLHTDFNWHSKLQMHRRLNLLVYLNSDWKQEWNGAIELWDADAKNKIAHVFPELGKALLFETSDISYHGHPDPLLVPDGLLRKSIAMYYYTPSRPEAEIIFGKSEMTNYVERPGEAFANDKIRRFRHKLQLVAKRIKHAAYKLTGD